MYVHCNEVLECVLFLSTFFLVNSGWHITLVIKLYIFFSKGSIHCHYELIYMSIDLLVSSLGVINSMSWTYTKCLDGLGCIDPTETRKTQQSESKIYIQYLQR